MTYKQKILPEYGYRVIEGEIPKLKVPKTRQKRLEKFLNKDKINEIMSFNEAKKLFLKSGKLPDDILSYHSVPVDIDGSIEQLLKRNPEDWINIYRTSGSVGKTKVKRLKFKYFL